MILGKEWGFGLTLSTGNHVYTFQPDGDVGAWVITDTGAESYIYGHVNFLLLDDLCSDTRVISSIQLLYFIIIFYFQVFRSQFDYFTLVSFYLFRC